MQLFDSVCLWEEMGSGSSCTTFLNQIILNFSSLLLSCLRLVQSSVYSRARLTPPLRHGPHGICAECPIQSFSGVSPLWLVAMRVILICVNSGKRSAQLPSYFPFLGNFCSSLWSFTLYMHVQIFIYPKTPEALIQNYGALSLSSSLTLSTLPVILAALASLNSSLFPQVSETTGVCLSLLFLLCHLEVASRWKSGSIIGLLFFRCHSFLLLSSV